MLNSILRTSEAVTSTQAVALSDVRKVHGRGDGSVVALDGVTVGLAMVLLAAWIWRDVNQPSSVCNDSPTLVAV